MQNSWNTFLSNSSGIDSFERLLADFKHYKEPLHYQEKIEHIDNINIKNISLSFRGKKAIDNISFSIKKNSSINIREREAKNPIRIYIRSFLENKVL